MQFLVVLVRFLLDRLMSDSHDGLAMAVRADGQIEQLPTRWTQWAQRCSQWMSASAWHRAPTRDWRRRGDGAREAVPRDGDHRPA
jgi:hypothetical protein